jgi:hypothetical protein
VLWIVLIAVVLGGAGVIFAIYEHNKSTTAAPKPPAVGACVNKGTDQPVMMVPAACSGAQYQVAKVVTGSTDQTVCNGVSDTFYKFVWPPDATSDYILCLKSQG